MITSIQKIDYIVQYMYVLTLWIAPWLKLFSHLFDFAVSCWTYSHLLNFKHFSHLLDFLVICLNFECSSHLLDFPVICWTYSH